MDPWRLLLEFVLAIAIAFAGFVLRGVVQKSDSTHTAVQALAELVAAFRGETRAAIGDLAERISRLERVQDEDNRDRKQT